MTFNSLLQLNFIKTKYTLSTYISTAFKSQFLLKKKKGYDYLITWIQSGG